MNYWRELQIKENAMEIKRSGSRPSGEGPSEWFTGAVRIDPLFQGGAPARVAGNAVTFEPGARTAWHTHPLGQALIVTAGYGLVQREGGPVEEIRPGDVVWFEPGEKHWHGASPVTAMTHIAIQEALEGKAVDWMEHVSDKQYWDRGELSRVNKTICEAIRTRSLILLVYDGGFRRIEPYVYGLSAKGNALLRAYQVAGASVSKEPVQWKLFEVAKISSMAISSETFPDNRRDYNPQDPIIRTVYCQVGVSDALQ